MTRESTNRLLMDGKNLRYEDNYSLFTYSGGSIQNHKRLIFCDGNTTKGFISEAENRSSFPEGFIDSATGLGASNPILLWPVTMTFRGVGPQFSPCPLEGLMPKGAFVYIAGVECSEYEIRNGNKAIRFWLDPTRDFVPRRIEYRKADVVQGQLEIAFGRREPGNWIPVSWVWEEYFPIGNTSNTTRVEVVSLKLHEPQPPDPVRHHIPTPEPA